MKEEGMKRKKAFHLVLRYLLTKKTRVILSSVFFVLNLFLLYFGSEFYFRGNQFIGELSKEYYSHETVKIQEKVTIAEEGHLTLNRYQIPSKEKIQTASEKEPVVSLAYFLPESYSLSLKGKEAVVRILPVLEQKEEKLKSGKRMEGEEVIVNPSFLTTFGLREEEALGFSFSLSYSFLFQLKQTEQKELIPMNYSFEIVGVSKEKKLWNEPTVYYDYDSIFQKISKVKVENLSLKENRDVYLSEFLDYQRYTTEDFLSYALYVQIDEPITAKEKQDGLLLTNPSLTFFDAADQALDSCIKIILLFLLLNLILSFLCCFLLMYSLYEDNIRLFALLSVFSFQRTNRRRLVLMFSLVFTLLCLSLLAFTIIFSSYMVDWILVSFSYPKLFYGISFPILFLLILLIFLFSFFASFFALHRVKEEEVKKELQGEN